MAAIDAHDQQDQSQSIEQLQKQVQQSAEADPFGDEHAQNQEQLFQLMREDAESELAAGRPVVYQGTGSNPVHYTITPSAKEAGKYQVTQYNDAGALSDTRHDTIADAMQEHETALAYGARKVEGEQANALMMELMQAESAYQDRQQEQDFNLQTQTEEQRAQQEAEVKAAAEAEAKAKRQADDAERKRKEQEADKARADEAAEHFELGQSSDDAMSGMDDIFSQQAQQTQSQEQAAPSPETFIKAPDGSLDFGEITKEISKELRRQAGKIRLLQGEHLGNHKGYGKEHIKVEHPEVGDPAQFVSSVAGSFDSIYKGKKGRLKLVKRGSPNELLVVELTPHEDADYYSVVSAYKSRKETGEPLWNAPHSRSASRGNQPAFYENQPPNSAAEAASSDKQTAVEPSISQTEKPAQQDKANLPDILSKTRRQYLNQQIKNAQLKKGSPGYADAVAAIEARYDDELEAAYAQLDFETYNKLNSDTPESINRAAWESMQQPVKAQDGQQLDGTNTGLKFSRAAKTSNDNNLIITHNLTESNLHHAQRMGGLAVPSLAVTTTDQPLVGFGEITLIGPAQMAQPSRDTKVFGADIYSPRYPAYELEIDSKALTAWNKELEQTRTELGENELYSDNLTRDGQRSAERDVVVMAQFLKDSGKKPKYVMEQTMKPARAKAIREAGLSRYMKETNAFKMEDDPKFREKAVELRASELQRIIDERAGHTGLAARLTERLEELRTSEAAQNREARELAQEIATSARRAQNPRADRYETQRELEKQIERGKLQNKYQQYVADKLAGVTKGERIFDGHTNSGNRKYIPHTLERVVRILKTNLRGGENFNYGGGSVRAAVTPEFKSVQQIRNNKDRLISEEAFEPLKREIDDELMAIVDALGINTTYTSEVLQEAAKVGVRRAFSNEGIEASEAVIKQASDFMEKLRALPTAYFEAKITRAVQLSEFAIAVAPRNIKPETKKALQDAGLTVRYYTPSDKEARAQAIRSAADKAGSKVKFSRSKSTGSTVQGIRESLRKTYGKLIDKLEASGKVKLVQGIEQAIYAAAKARAAITGQSVESIKQSLMASVQNQIAYHGTPYRGIEQTGFKLNKIGTGEGAQVFGWGIYFAGSKEVAQYYRESLSQTSGGFYIDGKEVDRNDVLWHSIDNMSKFGKQHAIEQLDSSIEFYSDYAPHMAKAYKQAKQRIETLDESSVTHDGGQLYRAEVPEDSDLLDYDKPLSQQPKKVRDALLKLNDATITKAMTTEPVSMDDGDYWAFMGNTYSTKREALDDYTPEKLVTGRLGNFKSPQAVAEAMQSVGIPGLRYLDGNSRMAGKGSHNYVIWDEALLTPEAAQIEPLYSSNGDVEGFYDPQAGQSYLIADALTEETAPGTLMHEVGIHMAADGAHMTELFGRAEQLLNQYPNNPFMRRVKKRMEEAGETSAEEAAAYIVTEYENNRALAPKTIGQFVKDMLAAIRGWMFRNGYGIKAGSLTAADIAAIARANARTISGGTGGHDVFFSKASITPWPVNFPRAIAHTSIAKVTSHPDYAAAKSGDLTAARKLVADTVKQERLKMLASNYEGAIVVPVREVEASGKNAIPYALAEAIAAHGMKIQNSKPIIIQTTTVKRKDLDAIQRLKARKTFDGLVVPGQQYIIVDDVLTQGGTVHELRTHIVNNGGEVAAVSALAFAAGSNIIAIQQGTIDSIVSRFGRERTERLLQEHNISGVIESLTESEGRAIARFKTFDALRNRLAQTDVRGVGGVNQEATPSHKVRVDSGQDNNIRRSFAGRSSKTANQHALSSAQQRIEAGENAEQVRQDTGWHIGNDGKWRYEISDAVIAEAQRQFAETEKAYGGRKAYDKAKADGKTKLNYQQWVQVRTPAFKKWFGDWEVALAKLKRKAGNFTEARQAAKAFQGKPLTNHGTGIVATASRNNLDKMLNQKAVGKSASPALHSAAVANLDSMFERAVLGWSKPDNEGDPNIKAIHRFFTPVMVDGKAMMAKMTVKETGLVGDNNPLYTVEAISFEEKRSPAAQWVAEIAEADGIDPKTTRSAGLIQSMAQSVQQFNPASVSKVTDPETGEPLVVYHGTRDEFTAFDDAMAGNKFDNGFLGRGFYFSGSRETSETYSRNKSGPTEPKVMSTYLSLRSPLVLTLPGTKTKVEVVREALGLKYDRSFENVTASAAREVSDRLRAGGYDGVVLEMKFRSGISKEYTALRPIQIKSATGNVGTFSADTGDIRFSRAAAQPADNTPDTLTGLAASKFDDFLYKIQDKQIDTKRIVQSIKDTAGGINDALDTYLQETLFHGRAAKRTQDFVRLELGDLTKAMQAGGITKDALEEYLHARHAQEANATLAERNPNQEMIDAGFSAAQQQVDALTQHLENTPTDKQAKRDLKDAQKELKKWRTAKPFKGTEAERNALSGMSNTEAQAVLSSLNPIQRPHMNTATAMIDAIIAKTRQEMVEYGLESQETIDQWASQWDHYIPLMREQLEDETGGMRGIGQGYSVKGREAKGRTGSTKQVVDILANIAMQRERIIVRGEKNRVAQSLLGLARENPIDGFWKTDTVPTVREIDPATGLVHNRPDPTYRNKENAVIAKVGGKEYAVLFDEDNARAMRMAVSLKNLDAAQMEGLMGAVATATRYFAAVNTQYNPIFGVTNFVRDYQHAMLALSNTPLHGKQAQIAGDVFKAVGQIFKAERSTRKGDTVSSEWGMLWDEFQQVGGQTGYRDQYANAADRGKAIEKALNPDTWAESKLGRLITADGRLKAPLA